MDANVATDSSRRQPQKGTKIIKLSEIHLCFLWLSICIILRMSESNLRSRMTNLLLVIPNLLLLSSRLMVDPRVPAKERLLVAGAIVYAFVPFDFIPDMLPFVGQVDDAYLITLTLLRLMTVTDPRVVREHWRGGGDVVELIGATALLAARLLPRRIRRVLTSRVETPGTASGRNDTIAAPLLIERPAAEAKTAPSN